MASVAAAMTEDFPVKRVVGIEHWIEFFPLGSRQNPRPRDILRSRGHHESKAGLDAVFLRKNASDVELIQQIYDLKVGWLGNYWSLNMPIEFKYANIKIGDVVDFYTTSDGVLKIPPWTWFKYALDEYLAEAPALRFHPSRVRAFIKENGVDQLDNME